MPGNTMNCSEDIAPKPGPSSLDATSTPAGLNRPMIESAPSAALSVEMLSKPVPGTLNEKKSSDGLANVRSPSITMSAASLTTNWAVDQVSLGSASFTEAADAIDAAPSHAAAATAVRAALRFIGVLLSLPAAGHRSVQAGSH